MARTREHLTQVFGKCGRARMFDIGIWTLIFGALQTIALFITFMIMAYVGVRQLRAYISPGVNGIKKFSLTDPIEITITLKNAGQTPARECVSSGVVFVATLPLDDDSKMPEPAEPAGILRHSKSGIYPQGELTFDCESIDLLNSTIIDGLRTGKAAIYVAGEVRYKDMFNINRRSEFCWFIDPKHASLLIDESRGRNVTVPPIINFVSAHVWNGAT
jgi:hypothetical protein